MSTLVFVLVFVLLGLGTLLFAMSGGRGGLGDVLHSQSRGSRRFATFAFFASLLVLGIGVPAAVIASVSGNDDIPHAQVKGLTAEEKHGQELFGKRCSLCHALKAANAVAQVGPDLDAIGSERGVHAEGDRRRARERQRADARRDLHRQGRRSRREIRRKVRRHRRVVRRLM